MTAITQTIKLKSGVPTRSIALPVEHGAWGFLFEPAIAGLFLAPSPAAPFILLFVIGAFLTRQPLKFLLADFLQKKHLPRTKLALRFSLIFGFAAALGLLGMILFAPKQSLIPFALAVPMVIYLIFQDVSRKTRELLPEILAAAALSSSVTVFAVADGWNYLPAFTLWSLMLARLIPSVLYVRSRLRLEKGKEFSRLAPIAVHVLALAAVAVFYFFDLCSILTVLTAAFLLGRAFFGLSRFRQPAKAKIIGIREVIYGVIYASAIIAGWYLKL